MYDFFVSRADGGQHAAQLRPGRRRRRRTQNSRDKAAPAPAWARGVLLEIKPGASTGAGLWKRCSTWATAQKRRNASSTAALQSACERSLPRCTPRAPQAFSEKPDTFKISSRSRWERALSWPPVGQVQFGNGPLRRQRRGVHHPGVRDQFAAGGRRKPPPVPAARRSADCGSTTSANSIFSSNIGLGGGVRRICFASAMSNIVFAVRDVGQVEQFKKTINRVAF